MILVRKKIIKKKIIYFLKVMSGSKFEHLYGYNPLDDILDDILDDTLDDKNKNLTDEKKSEYINITVDQLKISKEDAKLRLEKYNWDLFKTMNPRNT
jgi:hypothetical protein